MNISSSEGISGEEKVRPMRQRHRMYGEKVCAVCGDKALAHHFGTLACETCKAFFRRNALKNQEVRKCLFQGNCPIDKKTRRFCPACRLQRCLAVGMQSDLILDDNERQERMKKMFENRAKRCQQPEGSYALRQPIEYDVSTTCHGVTLSPEKSDQSGSSSPGSQLTKSDVLETDTSNSASGMLPNSDIPLKHVNGELTTNSDVIRLVNCDVSDIFSESNGQLSEVHDAKCASVVNQVQSPNQTSVSYYLDPDSAGTPLPSIIHVSSHQHPPTSQSSSQPPVSVMSGSLLKDGPFQHIPREKLPSDPYMYWHLSKDERCLLTHLAAAYQDTVLSILQKNPPKEVLSVDILSLDMQLEECETEARNVISFVKRLEDFQCLSLDDQIALLKASTTQTLGLRSCALYIAEKDAWLSQKGYVTFEGVRRLYQENPFLDIGVDICRNIKAIVKNDVTLYALLHCTILFDPSDERVINRQLINSIRDKYIILLRHYLEYQFSYLYSEKYFMALQGILLKHRDIVRDEDHMLVIRRLFPSVPNQLLIELMDFQ